MRTVLLAGGTGGAKLARGMVAELPSEDVTIVTNTADDDVFHGLLVSPDTDSVLYHLAGCFDDLRGFGIAGDTFSAMAMLERLGEPAWFRLGDRDLAVQLVRHRVLTGGGSLSDAVTSIAERLGVRARVLPMSDDPVRTHIATDSGELRLQEWFVRERCEPPVRGVRLAGVEAARPAAGVTVSLAAADALIIGPSNPVLSIDPILHVIGTAPSMPVIAVSPLVGGRALKGPTARMLQELGMEANAAGIARHYQEVASDFIIDTVDAHLADAVASLGMRPHVVDTVMRDALAERSLAAAVLRIARQVAT